MKHKLWGHFSVRDDHTIYRVERNEQLDHLDKIIFFDVQDAEGAGHSFTCLGSIIQRCLTTQEAVVTEIAPSRQYGGLGFLLVIF
jgi:hypothetical protein